MKSLTAMFVCGVLRIFWARDDTRLDIVWRSEIKLHDRS